MLIIASSYISVCGSEITTSDAFFYSGCQIIRFAGIMKEDAYEYSNFQVFCLNYWSLNLMRLFYANQIQFLVHLLNE